MTLTRRGAGRGRVWQRRSGTAPWYLVYLLVLGFPLVFDSSATVAAWTVSLVLAAGFSAFYLAVGAAPPGSTLHRAAPVVAAVAGLAVVPVNPGATVLMVYSAAFAAEAWSRRGAVRWFAVLTLACAAPLVLSGVPVGYRFWSVLPSALFVWVIGTEVLGGTERERANAALRVENSRIEAIATLTERERLARDVHDAVGQSLTSVIVRSQLARRLVTADPQRAVAELAELERVARAALSDVRTTVSGWRHVHLDDEMALATATLAAAGVVASVEREGVAGITPEAETVLALALREAVTNVVRHAGASQVSVAVRREGAEVAVVVTDDGGGVRSPVGGGLTGMRERVQALGGRVEVERAVPGGTRLRAGVPVGQPAGAGAGVRDAALARGSRVGR